MAYSLQKFYANNTILTNLHPDHLDWHRDLAEYYNSKLNLLAHTKESIVYPQSVLSIFPTLRDFPLQAYILPENMTQEHGLLQITEEAYIDVSDIQLF